MNKTTYFTDNKDENSTKIHKLIDFMKDHTNKEAADHFGVSIRTIARKLESTGLKYYDFKYGDYPKELSDHQQDIINGTLLGDGTVHKQGRYKFCQCDDHKGYVDYFCEVMKPFTREVKDRLDEKPNNKNGKVLDLSCWDGEYLKAWYVETITSPIFKELRKKWYPDGEKIVPRDLVLNARTIAYWFMDDGVNNQKKRTASFCTQGFTTDDIDFLINQLEKLNVKSTRQRSDTKFIIAVSCKDYFNFIEMIEPYVTIECMRYKIDRSNATKAKEGWFPGKLNFTKAREIRCKYMSGLYQQRELAEIYEVSLSTICKVVNNKIYPEPIFSLGGGAEYKIITPK